MKILVVSDIHYSLRQFDWLAKTAGSCDLMVVAGDMMELGSYVDADTQAVVVEQYFRRICAKVPLVVCSGNHDLVDEGDGTRSAEWLEDLAIAGLVVDRGMYEDERFRVLAFPWWEGEVAREGVEEWLAEQYESPDERPDLWVHHAPPQGARTSWNGKRDLGDPTLVSWIERYQPTVVFSGHVHNAPYYPEGGWYDRIGETVVINGGRQIGEVPATVTMEFEAGCLTWCGMEGCEDAPFTLSH